MKIKGSEVESTPFTIVEVTATGDETIAVCNLYWTARSGVAGYQVASCGWYLDTGDLVQFESKTSGGGYCKATAAFEDFCARIGVDWRAGAEPARALKGAGNYRRVSLTALKRAAR
jgi:hypothetical protein